MCHLIMTGRKMIHKIINKMADMAQGLPGLMALFILGFAASLITPGGQANANPIGGPGVTCKNSSCQGSIYTLTYDGSALPDSDPDHETYQITYTIDTSGYTGGGVAIDSAAIKVSAKVFSATLFDAPGGTNNWDLIAGGINAGGCSGKGGGFECADWIGSGVGATVGGILTWIFDITVDNDKLFTATGGTPSIKARYVDARGGKVGALVSENIELQIGRSTTSIPEPATLVLLGCGLLGLVFLHRLKS